MSDSDDFETRQLARSDCVWQATWEGAHYGMYGLAAGLLGVLAGSNFSTGFRALNTSAKTALVRVHCLRVFSGEGDPSLLGKQCVVKRCSRAYSPQAEPKTQSVRKF